MDEPKHQVSVALRPRKPLGDAATAVRSLVLYFGNNLTLPRLTVKKNITKLTSMGAVKEAIAECDALGREQFLSKYGYERARKYPLVFNGQEYDSKAIAGVAFGNQFGIPLKWDEFSGGLKSTVPTLQKLGFKVLLAGDMDGVAPMVGASLDHDVQKSLTRFFWVNVGQSYAEVLHSKFLWAPQFSEQPKDSKDLSKGTTIRYLEHWTNVSEVRAGDIIFGNVDRNILFVGVASKDAFAAPRPATRAFSQWGKMGFQVPIALFQLPVPLTVDGDIKDAFDLRYNKASNPLVFKANGDIFQGYMAAIPDAAGVEILQLVGDVEMDAVDASDRLRSPGRRTHQTHRKPSGTTTKQAIRDARVGQGYFRQELLKMWKCCPVTGVSNPSLLLASHTKPWSRSNDDERLDPFNGFLFAPNIDRSFDKGLISFTDSGLIIISDLLSGTDKSALGIHERMSISVSPEHAKYLAAHRELFDL